MASYTIYNTETGIIRKVLNVPDISIHIREGESYIAGSYASDSYKIISENPVEYDANPVSSEALNRQERDALLFDSDWTQVSDSPFSDSKKAEWTTYRQALRDLPTNSNWPNLEDADWPTQPT